ncbi:hypothetical protein NE237_017387 [Protea cynaroides]|uniref:Cytochrome P450 n=1 Tax=Protea cynaroides TaxID=273540 RepID=A0A9Q0K7Y4_9MAGN|nr:hypothetical protein NE237_017387 [Protea cynaroides]
MIENIIVGFFQYLFGIYTPLRPHTRYQILNYYQILNVQMSKFYYFLFFLAFFLLTKRLFGRRKNLPPSGPLCLPIIGLPYLLKKPFHRTLAGVSARYGAVLLLKLAAEECFTTNDIVFADRPHFLLGKYLGFNYTTPATASYGQDWRNLRRVTTLDMFSSTRLQMSSKIYTNEVRFLLRRLFMARNFSKTVEMKSLFFELTVNSMTMMMLAGKRYFGDDMGDLDKARQLRELIDEILVEAGKI